MLPALHEHDREVRPARSPRRTGRTALGLVAALVLVSAAASAAVRPGHSPAAGGAGIAERSVLPFSHDDYQAARARAQRESKLLIIETWATWCHTCQSMRSFVFTNPLLKPMADRFIFVSLDTDRPVNAAFVRRFPIMVWPTMLVIDPGQSSRSGDERVLGRWTGAQTAPELLGRLAKLTTRSEGVDRQLEQADAAAAEGRWEQATALYREAAGVTVSERPRALLGLIQAFTQRGDYRGCVDLVSTSLPATGNGAAATDFATYAVSCLDKEEDADLRQKLRLRLKEHVRSLVDDDRAPLSVDDRSDGFGTLIELSDALGDRPAGDRYAEARLRMLESAAAAARTAADAATFDQHRLESYRRLHRYEPAEKMLLQTARALPGDCNAPYRLAKLYYLMGRLDEAAAMVADALGKAYGTRRALALELQATIRHGQGQTREAVLSLTAAINVIESQPPRNEVKLQQLRRQVAAYQNALLTGTKQTGPTSALTPAVAPAVVDTSVLQVTRRPFAALRLPKGPLMMIVPASSNGLAEATPLTAQPAVFTAKLR